MCLLVTQSASAPTITSDWLVDMYSSNPDGVGVMYAKDNVLVVEKMLPTTASDFLEFYAKHIDGKDCAFHLRMKTHGAIDMTNCHPYPVLNRKQHGIDLWLMHNGILHTDNKADVTKSDTWHYINDYLRPMLHNNPDFAFHPSFIDIMGDHIGTSNKFVLMDNFGRTSTINKDSGVFWGGRWLSNTYAWTAPTTAGKKEDTLHDTKLAKSEIDKPPVVYNYTKSIGYEGYAHGYESGYYDNERWGDDKYDIEVEVDDALTDLELAGFTRAGKLSRRQGAEFARKFGIDSFWEITYMALEKDIDEDWFVRIMSDFATARESFPWLTDQARHITLN